MIKVSLNVDDICQDCPCFSYSTCHMTNFDNDHILAITCEHSELCEYLRNQIRKEK